MAVFEYDNLNNSVDISSAALGPYETGHMVRVFGGNDTVYGRSYNDIIEGGEGNDLLYGRYGDDGLIGENGNDILFGESGNDLLSGGAGSDSLLGGAGNDNLFGGTGNDTYYHGLNEGFDIINDDFSPAGNPGFGGGTDTLYLTSITSANLALAQIGNSLVVSSVADFSDGVINDGVMIQDFFLGGNNVIELLGTADNYVYDLTGLLS